MGPVGATAENYSCSASALAVGPYYDFGVPEGGRIEPNSPPKLVCAFTVVNGKLVITYKNIGGQPIKGFQTLNAKSEDPTLPSFSYVGEVNIPSGKTMQTTLDVAEPSQFIGKQCHADMLP